MSKTVQPPWQLPVRTVEHQEPVLVVYNSLTKTKTEFITKKPGVVSWYNCGPTVYDASHMGHARNYMTQDIMRRILRDYFGYELHFVTNVTDVDDKIILRARQSHLFDTYLKEVLAAPSPLSPTVIDDVKSAWSAYLFKSMNASISTPPPSTSFDSAVVAWNEILVKSEDEKWVMEQKVREEKWGMHVDSIRTGLAALNLAINQAAACNTGAQEATALLEGNRDAMSVMLDRKLGATLTDHAIFRNLAAYWEASFFKSMKALRVEDPTTLTRVSEYIPEIVNFTEGIINRGMAYEEGGSVYFNTTQFEGASGPTGEWKHTYAKLAPWSKGNRELLEDGEGSLSTGTGKRSAADFALWKSSKPGEPSWPSPWGLGRPGWHIECSVMASAVLGEGMDVHSGGADLAFPHHDNEIAQSEAYHNCRQWVNYFLHTGHLHIEGLKMSKSLKNFITIDDALTRYTARQLRLSFLSTAWHARLDFKESAMSDVRTSETVLNNFFANTKALVSERRLTAGISDGQHHFDQPERDLMHRLELAQLSFRAALCDSFDTNKGVQILFELVSAANTYLGRGRSCVNVEALSAVEEWITRMLRMLGLGEGAATNSMGERTIGWGTLAIEGETGTADRETILMPYIRTLSTFRDNVRRLVMNGASAAELLALSDQLRDTELVDLGVAVDDQEDGKALVKLVAPEVLRQAREEKLAMAAEKLARKAEAKAIEEAKRIERLQKGSLSPFDMFKTVEYSAWDEQGLPTIDKEGVEVAKSKSKKLKKEWDGQNKLWIAYKQWQSTQ